MAQQVEPPMTIARPDADAFEALHTKWARVHELLALGLLSPDLHAHLGAILEQLEAAMRQTAPARASAVFAPRPAGTGSGRLAA